VGGFDVWRALDERGPTAHIVFVVTTTIDSEVRA
jgi:hypothetical protein